MDQLRNVSGKWEEKKIKIEVCGDGDKTKGKRFITGRDSLAGPPTNCIESRIWLRQIVPSSQVIHPYEIDVVA